MHTITSFNFYSLQLRLTGATDTACSVCLLNTAAASVPSTGTGPRSRLGDTIVVNQISSRYRIEFDVTPESGLVALGCFRVIGYCPRGDQPYPGSMGTSTALILTDPATEGVPRWTNGDWTSPGWFKENKLLWDTGPVEFPQLCLQTVSPGPLTSSMTDGKLIFNGVHVREYQDEEVNVHDGTLSALPAEKYGLCLLIYLHLADGTSWSGTGSQGRIYLEN